MDYMPDQPDREQIAADELRIGELLRAVEAPAPAGLQQQIGELNEARSARTRPRRRRRPLIAIAVGFAGGIALALVLKGTPAPAQPTALRISTIALERATGPAPYRLTAAGTTITFPQWSSLGWPSLGTRSDSLDGRTVTTEFFRSYGGAGTLGYAIVSGTALQWGAAGRTLTHDGAHYWADAHAGAQILAWVQDGHTCVLVSRSASAATLLALAAQERATPL
ncbi:MAG: hypothetical protein ABSH27_07350 [Solirubrobacteraceae bacterium]|jgi:hypothetical protein